jgi:cysteine desulfurase/selenocysteine lyase
MLGSPVATTAVDADLLRQDFPILARQVNGRRLVYLDSAATSQKPLPVLAAMDDYYRQHNANVHRGVHTLAAEATELYERARTKVGRFLNAGDRREVVFTRGTTEAVNLVAHSWAAAQLADGDAVLLTEMEHHSNLVPWHLLAQRRAIELRYIPLRDDGTLDLDALPGLLDERVKLVAFTHVSNVLGTVNPVAELVASAHAIGARVLLDAAQSVPHRPVDVQALGVDFLAFSGHKACGPTGIGVLWGKLELLSELPPFLGGGEMIHRVSLSGSTFADVPARFEAGTPPIAEAVGLAAALDYLAGLGRDAIQEHGQALTDSLVAALSDMPGVQVVGPTVERGPAVAFTVDGIHPHDLATVLDGQGIAIRAGHHCAMPLHQRFGLPATARASIYLYNTPEDIAALLDGLHAARAMFGLS